MDRDRLLRNIAPHVNDGEATVLPDRLRYRRRVEHGLSRDEGRTPHIIPTWLLCQPLQTLRGAGQGVIAMRHASWALHFLPATNALLAPFPVRRPDVVVKRNNRCGPSDLSDQLLTFAVVMLNDVVVVEKVEVQVRQGTKTQLKPVFLDRATLVPLEDVNEQVRQLLRSV
jgi:hypothetical protein